LWENQKRFCLKFSLKWDEKYSYTKANGNYNKIMCHSLRIGSQIGPYDPFWVQVRESVYQKAQQLKINLVPIEIFEGPETPSAQEQASLVDELLAEDLGALICWNLPGDDFIRRLLDLGLPMIYLSEFPIQHPLFVSPRGLDQAARMAGEYFAEKLNGRGRVLCVGGHGLMDPPNEQNNNSLNRVIGIQETLKKYPEISFFHIPSVWRYEDALPQIEAGMRQLDQLPDAIFGLSDSLALAARDAGRTLGLVHKHTLIAGINGDPLALVAIADGSMSATVETSALDLGARAVELACQAARREALPDNFDYKMRLITSENVAEAALEKLIAIANIPSHLVGVNLHLERNRLTQLETSTAINRRVGSLLDRQELSREIADLIRSNYGYDQVQLFLWSEQEQLLVLDEPISFSGEQLSLPLQKSGLLAEALLQNEIILIPDALHSKRFPPDPRVMDVSSRVILPIRLGDKILGVLDLHSRNPKTQQREELIGLQSLADQLGIAMRNAELYSRALQARAAAEKADDLKTQLLANVSHELRPALNVILGYSQGALRVPNPYDPGLPPEVLRDFGHIYDSGEQLIRLINDLLDLSRSEIDALDLFPETFNPRPFLEKTFHSMTDHADEDVAWQLDLPEHLPMIQADPGRLRQILLNLLHNAQKFTSSGSITLGAEVEPPHLHLWVKDTGAGIPIEQQERIFEPFVSIGPAGQRQNGIGLGLSITRRLVTLHNGSMTLESQPMQGSTFHVYLPLPSLSGQPVRITGNADYPVLLLISNPKELPEALVELSQARRLAIHRLEPGDNLDALLVEVQPMALAWDLAGADFGDWTLIQRLRSHPQLCQLPFILYNHEEVEGASLSTGMADVVMKPVNPKTLTEMLDAIRPRVAAGPLLIVDDDPQARLLYQRLAAEALPGCPVIEAENRAAALAILERETPCLVVLDLIMPDVGGFTVLEQIRHNPRTRQVPVLVMSGRMLSLEDVHRLDYAQVTFHSKELLSSDEAVASLQRALSSEETLPQPTSILVKHALAYLHQNFANPITLQKVADAIGVTKNYLSNIFRQELGLSPWECLTRFRVQKAKWLLRNGEESIALVAAEAGFEDSAYFSRVFRKHVGMSPQEYRKQTG
jgi:signal transduction histidine kinase/AraC-like DNA-binding protein/ABC-type sugar transport system substrate-binding protein